jgi:hypothetical protein
VRPVLLCFATALALVAIWFDASPLLRGPAPYPPEWRWTYRSEPLLHGGLPALLCAGGLVTLIVVSGLRIAKKRPRLSAVILLTAASGLGWALQISLIALEKGGAVRTLVMRTVDPGFTSYYSVAISPLARDPSWFIEQHARLLRTTQLAHAGTHPPGAVLYYRAILSACQAAPALTEWLVQLAVRSGVDPRSFSLPAGATQLASALLAPLLLGLLCVLTCWPMAALASAFGASVMQAVRVGILWTVLPGPTLMTPELDQALALPVTATTALLAIACARTRTWRSTAGAALIAGVCAAVALFVSYGALVFLVFGGCVTVALVDARRLPHIALFVVLAGGVAAALNMLPVLLGHEPIAAMRAALATHHDRFTAPRSYRMWLLFNPWDLAVFLGIPIALLFVERSARVLTEVVRQGWRRPTSPMRRAQIVAATAIVTLIVSGIVRGEAGRIWIPIMPVLLLVSVVRDAVRRKDRQPAEGQTYRVVGPSVGETLLLTALLFAACWTLRLSWHLP